MALTQGRTGAPPPSTAAPMDTDLQPAAVAAKDAAGQVSGAGTAVKAGGTDDEQHNWVEPQAFKSLVGKGHADFSSGHQQVSPVALEFPCLALNNAYPISLTLCPVLHSLSP